jgi:hypothetical protein
VYIDTCNENEKQKKKIKIKMLKNNPKYTYMRVPFEKFVDWRQCAALMQRHAVTIMPSCSGGGNVVVACTSSL